MSRARDACCTRRPPLSHDPLAEAREWIARAAEDLSAAQLLSASSPPHLGTAAYHTQQAAEKALKGFLVAANVTFPLTHDLELLLPRCESLDPAFAAHRPAARTLTPYAVRFRYPGGPLHPSPADAGDAIRMADALLRFVRQRLGL